VEYAMQNPEIMEKQFKKSYRKKEYSFPSGQKVLVQGYEPFALDELVKLYPETDIIVDRTKVPKITYLDENNKEHRYYVDIYIPSQNLMIEVKSTWTLKKKNDNVYQKLEASKKAGYKCQIWVYKGNGKAEKEIIIE
jgi:hypothetical protein